MTNLEQSAPKHCEVERGVVIFNEHGLHFDTVKPALRDILTNSGIRHWTEIRTQANPLHTTEEIQEKTLDDALVVTFGGDGTVSTVTQALKNRRLYHLFAGGGCAIDVALQLNDIFSLKHPSRLKNEASAVNIHPLEFTIEHDGNISHHSAVGYVTGGTTPNIQRVLEQPKHRDHILRRSKHATVSLAYEATISMNELRKRTNRRPFRIQDNESGPSRTVLEIMAVNGARMAKVGRFAVNLTDSQFIHSEIAVSADRPLHNAYTIVKSMSQLVKGTYPGHLLSDGQELAFYLPKDEQPVGLQYDGELELLQPGSWLRVRRAASYFTALSTKLAPEAAA